MQTEKQKEGKEGEDWALAYLEKAGLVLRERNFLCRGGELDLIMQEGKGLVFVEVRRRKNADFGGALASVTYFKRLRLIRAAQTYLQRYTITPSCRFDVVAIEGEKIVWLKNVFDT